ncbi:MAG: FkbM family methyltransferase [Pseudomonadales bacterium]|nr:FkbM family methyltransferase [Pseudomonadales bacterium]MBO7004756.1 FkbM family methyltransferase [Pseudomonadales bacterium]
MLEQFQLDVETIWELKSADLQHLLSLKERSKSQLGQDLFVLLETGFKKDGYFVEFGATDGIALSNTYLLEKDYGWTGLVAEPARQWHEPLQMNRECSIDTRCVWKRSGEEVSFTECGELSTLDAYIDSDARGQIRRGGHSYPVETVTLKDLLREHSAPKFIDYLSLDTEGSEYDILSEFDFDEYFIQVISCEHNFLAIRTDIVELLEANGYERKFPALSRWDDWFVRSPA